MISYFWFKLQHLNRYHILHTDFNINSFLNFPLKFENFDKFVIYNEISTFWLIGYYELKILHFDWFHILVLNCNNLVDFIFCTKISISTFYSILDFPLKFENFDRFVIYNEISTCWFDILQWGFHIFDRFHILHT